MKKAEDMKRTLQVGLKTKLEGLFMKLREEDLKRELETAISGKDTQARCALRLGIGISTFERLLARARVHGIEAVLHSNRPKAYTDTLKLAVVHSVLEDGLPKLTAAIKYNLDKGTVDKWIYKYERGGESCLLEDNRGRASMGRKKKPKLEDYEPGSMEYLKLENELLKRENELLKKALPLVQEKIRSRSQGKSGTSSSEN